MDRKYILCSYLGPLDRETPGTYGALGFIGLWGQGLGFTAKDHKIWGEEGGRILGLGLGILGPLGVEGFAREFCRILAALATRVLQGVKTDHAVFFLELQVLCPLHSMLRSLDYYFVWTSYSPSLETQVPI